MTKITLKLNTFIIILSIALLVITGCFSTKTETEPPEESSKKSAEEKAEKTRDDAKEDYEKELKDDEDCESDDCQAAKEVLEDAEEEFAKAKRDDSEKEESSEELADESSEDAKEESSEANESSSEEENDESTTESESSSEDGPVADESSAAEEESVADESSAAEEESVADESSAAEESSSESPILGGVPLELPASKTESWDFLMMGDVKLLLNKWGSDARALEEDQECDSEYEIWAHEDETFGWTFNRPDCGGGGGFPDYPEVEVGVAPFDESDTLDLRKSTSTILPKQIKDITSASVTLDDFRIDLTSDASWNINFELWLSQEDPTTTSKPKPEFELMTFWGWHDKRWACNQADGEFKDNLTLPKGFGSMDYTLCHYGKDWGGSGDSKWDYFQFRAGDGGDHNSKRDFTGKLDVKETLDWLVKHAGASPDLWVTRFEVGTEIDNNTAGTVSFKGVIFEVNGEERSPEFVN